MSYNIHHCNPPSRSNFIDVNAVVNAINAEKPDLIALQEVDVNTVRSGNMNQAQELASKLRMHHYFFGKAIDYQGGEYGVAILSKYPLSEREVHRLPVKQGSGGEPRILATAIVKLPDGSSVRFASTHLDAQSDPTNRQLQIEKIVDIASNDNLPFIIAGDFNATPGSNVINTLDAHFRRTCQVCAGTIPATNPTKAIDFIAYKHPRNKFRVGSHKVVNESYASDHRPVVAVINIEE
ncbi:endonuclease/exonuclease/phosphatase family protein [Pontibacter harenae]|uniref:endonuclease/exonuclease/phosphatase family protein n=1 Tax=Pontibacter harenae TaxID=2894083 RepID=UPI001E2FD8D1|nr:endonuclease/exonuclease/phosphatase family protein [Pontibacter harenae]MCC9168433.1 endonuclease/exonuclease/phosphatase family protein [Pontibacter harenae]